MLVKGIFYSKSNNNNNNNNGEDTVLPVIFDLFPK